MHGATQANNKAGRRRDHHVEKHHERAPEWFDGSVLDHGKLGLDPLRSPSRLSPVWNATCVPLPTPTTPSEAAGEGKEEEMRKETRKKTMTVLPALLLKLTQNAAITVAWSCLSFVADYISKNSEEEVADCFCTYGEHACSYEPLYIVRLRLSSLHSRVFVTSPDHNGSVKSQV